MSTVCVSKALENARSHYKERGCLGKEAQNTDGELVYISCPISDKSLEAFQPYRFNGARWLGGAFDEKAVKMRQDVSMFQCTEHKRTRQEKEGDKMKEIVTWEYKQEWHGSHVDASSFKAWSNSEAGRALRSACGSDFKGNPYFPMNSETLSARKLFAGDYDVTRHLDQVSLRSPVSLKQGSYRSPLPVSSSGLHSDHRVARDGNSYTRGEFIEHYGYEKGNREWEAAENTPVGRGSSVQVYGNTAKTCHGDVIGCLKISYTKSSSTHVSLMAAAGYYTGETKAWPSPASWMCPSSASASQVDLFSEKKVSANRLVDDAQFANSASTWVIRLVCFVLVIVGVYSFLQPIQYIADTIDHFLDWFKFIPILGWLLDFLGNVVSGAARLVIFCISVGIGAPSALTVMSIAWLIMRPLFGIPMVILCAACIGMTVKAMVGYADVGRGKRQKKTA
jgi:hypothetical protein